MAKPRRRSKRDVVAEKPRIRSAFADVTAQLKRRSGIEMEAGLGLERRPQAHALWRKSGN